jgi:uncharacterized protein YkwD
VKYVLSLGLFFMLVACGGSSVPQPEPTTPNQPATTPTETSLSAEMQTLLALVNEARTKGHDCGSEGNFAPTKPLVFNGKLTLAAQYHSADLSATNVKTNMHVTPAGALNYTPGMSFTERIDAENYDWATAGENVAYNFATPELVMKAWLASSGHCKNIMNPGFTELGLGKAGAYWTQVFAAPRS